jgi:hypothetical protein
VETLDHLLNAISHLKDVGQMLAWFAAALFFVYQVRSGRLIGGVSLRLCCDRKPSRAAGMDYLSIVAILKRNGGSKLLLHDARVRVSLAQGTAPREVHQLPEATTLPASPESETKMIGIERLSFGTTSSRVLKIKFDVREPVAFLHVAPTDETQFATLYEISTDQPYIVEAAIFGRRRATRIRSQWRASAISLPNTINKP